MIEKRPEPWDVWHARFNYEGGRGYKYRPVIVAAVSDWSMVVIMVTSTMNKLHCPHDIVVRDWAEAGLDKPSIVRIDRIAEIPFQYAGTAGRIGRLTAHDIKVVKAALDELD